MRIGILTLPLHTNYGGILQAYALQTVLERMGHQVVIIDEPIRQQKTSFKQIFKRIIKKCIGRPTTVFWEKYFFTSYPTISRNIQTFIDKYLHRLVVDSPYMLQEEDFDAIIVGSDQIWRPKYYDHIENAYLDFAKDWKSLKRIAYAPSFGTNEWEYTADQTKEISNFLKRFDAISVREESGINLCKEHLDVVPQLVLDPTLLLSKDDYCKLIDKANPKSHKGKLLDYVLDDSESISSLISYISGERNIQPFSVNGKPFAEGTKAEDCVKPSIESWLRGFRDADFVVTDSFHACAFSMIFNKPFCVVGNKTRGMARFNSLLKIFHQEFRLIENVEQYKKNATLIRNSPNINLDDLNIRRESYEFLKNALN